MKKITFLINLFLLMTLLAANSSAIGQLLVEDFNYTVGSVITSTSTADPTTGWLAHSGNNTANIDVTNGLTFEGYAGSGIGGAANLDATGQDINKPFTAQTSGVIYAAFIIKTETPNAAGYFFHFGPNPIGSTFFTRLYLNSTGDGVGIGLGNNPPATFVPITPGNPALLVVKLDIASKLTSLYVLNTFVLSEPATADHTVTETTPFSNVGSVALRQYNGSQRIIVDGIRVATTWVEAVAPASSTPTVSTPTFSPAAGTYYAAQNVTISIGTEGATIYYTTDGTDPDNTDTEYTTPIAVSATTTVKAIAYKTDMDPSAVASAVYTFPTINNVSDIATLRAGATDGTAYKLTGEAIMTFKTANRNAKYIQDSTGGILIDDVSGKITTSYNVNDGITGIIGTLNLYSGMLQFVPGVDPGAASSHNNTVTPDETTLTNIGNYPGQLVKVSGVTIAEAGNFAASTNYTLSDGTNSGVLRTQYSDLPYIGSAIPTVPQDIIGVVLMNNTTAQLVPRTADDFSNTVFESPTILVAEAEVATMSAQVGTVDAETITVNGQNLTGNIILSVTGTDASLFTLSTYSIVPTGGRVTDQMVTITYAPTTAGSHTATLTLSSAGVESVTRTLSGEVLSVPDVIITEVYGGGGNSDAPYTHDFFELYNTTDNSVSVAGWSIQYYSATTTGTSSSIIVIPAGKYIPARSHFLIQGSGGSTGVALPTPDAIGTINAGASSGKVILFTTDAAQTISDIASITGNVNFKDYMPFGTTATPVWGSAMFSNTSNTTSATRKKVAGEYVYTQNIGNDFEVIAPSPGNTGLLTSTNSQTINANIYAHNAKIHFSATAGERVEVYNAVGQKIISTLATDGQNELTVNGKGVIIVKVGSRLAKVIL